ncbi:ABC transporter ATP-binding protein [Alteribacter natronophilus]|uniref:ABC transporter ATP-binding protein n=1 Tax=Alteribacter natronophilus TaxID=2583810 RepID=UPI00110D39BE|nr:ABC transporter ATP-binding protein [Alteribacter natronophilus]TMW73382.1 ABC transporter ATP-binding protein [Alteribacter natronophilus]
MIEVKHVHYAYTIGKKGKRTDVPVLRDVNFEIRKGEITAIAGKSGSGKSTLLNLLSGFISVDSGMITINGKDVTGLSEKGWSSFRLEHIGFVFQNYELIPGLTALENIELPMVLKGENQRLRREKAEKMLRKVGLEHQSSHYPNELSGGQQQRVSIGRALINEPAIIFADEPTGSLDSETEQDILTLIRTLNEEKNITFVLITHDHEVASRADRRLTLTDGRLTEERGEYSEAK